MGASLTLSAMEGRSQWAEYTPLTPPLTPKKGPQTQRSSKPWSWTLRDVSKLQFEEHQRGSDDDAGPRSPCPKGSRRFAVGWPELDICCPRTPTKRPFPLSPSVVKQQGVNDEKRCVGGGGGGGGGNFCNSAFYPNHIDPVTSGRETFMKESPQEEIIPIKLQDPPKGKSKKSDDVAMETTQWMNPTEMGDVDEEIPSKSQRLYPYLKDFQFARPGPVAPTCSLKLRPISPSQRGRTMSDMVKSPVVFSDLQWNLQATGGEERVFVFPEVSGDGERKQLCRRDSESHPFASLMTASVPGGDSEGSTSGEGFKSQIHGQRETTVAELMMERENVEVCLESDKRFSVDETNPDVMDGRLGSPGAYKTSRIGNRRETVLETDHVCLHSNRCRPRHAAGVVFYDKEDGKEGGLHGCSAYSPGYSRRLLRQGEAVWRENSGAWNGSEVSDVNPRLDDSWIDSERQPVVNSIRRSWSDPSQFEEYNRATELPAHFRFPPFGSSYPLCDEMRRLGQHAKLRPASDTTPLRPREYPESSLGYHQIKMAQSPSSVAPPAMLGFCQPSSGMKSHLPSPRCSGQPFARRKLFSESTAERRLSGALERPVGGTERQEITEENLSKNELYAFLVSKGILNAERVNQFQELDNNAHAIPWTSASGYGRQHQEPRFKVIVIQDGALPEAARSTSSRASGCDCMCSGRYRYSNTTETLCPRQRRGQGSDGAGPGKDAEFVPHLAAGEIRSLQDDLRRLSEQGSADCDCGRLTIDAARTVVDAFAKVRRRDDSPEAFEEYLREQRETHKVLWEMLKTLKELKRICNHQRR